MGDEDQSLASFTTCTRQQLGDLSCVLIVEVADRLVGENERGIVDEGPGNGDALLLAAAQFRRPVPGAIAKETASRSSRARRVSAWRFGSIGTRMFSRAVSCGSRL